MPEHTYGPPVAQLLTYGDCRNLPQWPKELDYLQLGFSAEDIPALIELVTDEELLWVDPDTLDVWAPIHAWRTLGQLRAEAAIEPLLGLLRLIDDDDNDWVGEEMPEVFGLIGPVAIPALSAYLANPQNLRWACITAAEMLQRIAEMHPEAKPAVVTVLTAVLDDYADNDRTVNAFVISNLLDLKAVGSVQLMERAFAADAVDLSVGGDWEEVQIEMGWKIARETPIPAGGWFRAENERETVEHATRNEAAGRLLVKTHQPRSKVKAKAKAKRKQANTSRQKNRKH